MNPMTKILKHSVIVLLADAFRGDKLFPFFAGDALEHPQAPAGSLKPALAVSWRNINTTPLTFQPKCSSALTLMSRRMYIGPGEPGNISDKTVNRPR